MLGDKRITEVLSTVGYYVTRRDEHSRSHERMLKERGKIFPPDWERTVRASVLGEAWRDCAGVLRYVPVRGSLISLSNRPVAVEYSTLMNTQGLSSSGR